MEEKIILTPQEAVDAIKSNYPQSGYYVLQASRDMAIELLSKHIEKPLIYRRWDPAECPTCGCTAFSDPIEDGYYDHHTDFNTCPRCGQKVLWPGKYTVRVTKYTVD